MIESSGSLVLMYHRVGSPFVRSTVRGQYVLPALLRGQLRALLGRGYQPRLLRDLLAAPEMPAGAFSVTFDDGYASIAALAAPIFAGLRVPMTVFVVAGAVGQTNIWDQRQGDREERILSREALRALAAEGMEIGSHTLTHAHLPQLADAELRAEVADSKARLEDLLGCPVSGFAYPYGELDARVRAAVIAAGYSYAVSTRKGTLAGPVDRFALPRLNMRWNTIGPLLTWKIARAHHAATKLAHEGLP